jgi:uncharacterized membrane protein (DUF2068 family)
MDKRSPLGLRIIAAAKIVKAVALGGLSLGLFDLIHKDLSAVALHFVQIARISPENRYVGLMLEKLGLVDPTQLRRFGELSALYAIILMTEGLGLWFGTAWAEYVVVVSSGVFVPEECLATLRHFTWLKLGVLVLNAVILIYVVCLVWNRFQSRRAARAAAPQA